MKFLLSLFALLLFTESCNSSKEIIEDNTIENKNIMQNTLSGTYTITQIEKNEAVSPKLQITFNEISNKVNGFGGCNSFFGTYAVDNENITFSNIASSKKLCQKDISTLESHFLSALKRTNTFSIKNNILLLLENDIALIKAVKNKVSKADSIKNNNTEKSDIVRGNNQTAVVYTATTRGLYNYTQISKSNITTSSDRSLQKTDIYNCVEKDWIALNKLIEAIDLEAINKLKAPSNERATDAALSANLAIQIGDVYYMVPEFDHGNPPKEILALVNKVLSIRENAIKK